MIFRPWFSTEAILKVYGSGILLLSSRNYGAPKDIWVYRGPWWLCKCLALWLWCWCKVLRRYQDIAFSTFLASSHSLSVTLSCLWIKATDYYTKIINKNSAVNRDVCIFPFLYQDSEVNACAYFQLPDRCCMPQSITYPSWWSWKLWDESHAVCWVCQGRVAYSPSSNLPEDGSEVKILPCGIYLGIDIYWRELWWK